VETLGYQRMQMAISPRANDACEQNRKKKLISSDFLAFVVISFFFVLDGVLWLAGQSFLLIFSLVTCDRTERYL